MRGGDGALRGGGMPPPLQAAWPQAGARPQLQQGLVPRVAPRLVAPEQGLAAPHPARERRGNQHLPIQTRGGAATGPQLPQIHSITPTPDGEGEGPAMCSAMKQGPQMGGAHLFVARRMLGLFSSLLLLLLAVLWLAHS